MAKLKDIRKGGYRPFGMDDDDFVDIRELVGAEISILACEAYTNQHEENGVYVKFNCKQFDGARFTATKALGVVAALADPDVLDTLKTEAIECRVSKRPSRRDASKTVIVLE